jgi:hypothetical protein
MKFGELLDEVRTCQLLWKDSAAWRNDLDFQSKSEVAFELGYNATFRSSSSP